MPDRNLLAVLAATIAAFVSGATYYPLLGDQLAQVSDAAASGDQPAHWKLAVEFLRCLIIAAVGCGPGLSGRDQRMERRIVAGAGAMDRVSVRPVDGAMIHEDAPLKLAVIHAGDWLVKPLVVAVIVTVWQ